eukprot:CAMPEP_0182430368 /NCGR_PEP_ID=MMETSP1167-20130531/39882_1 /TAXON_ID=2988 /ORGANISM="Mallomonas Sp, Strain CCMP3275" /LENGTH=200 /DNA_ID=CAMNT_0024615377 /DNA_START=123 /DNA_END=722 /DNA_ORIENTATION=+
MQETLRSYSEVFGADNMYILDYYGVNASGMDVPTALYCSVVNPSPSCRDETLLIRSRCRNERFDVTPQVLYHTLRYYAQLQGCQFSPQYTGQKVFLIIPTCLSLSTNRVIDGTNESKEMLLKALDWPALPTTRIPLYRSLLSVSRDMDDFIRSQFPTRIYYGNVTANMAAAEKAYHSSTVIDRYALYTEKEWVTRLSVLL